MRASIGYPHLHPTLCELSRPCLDPGGVGPLAPGVGFSGGCHTSDRQALVRPLAAAWGSGALGGPAADAPRASSTECLVGSAAGTLDEWASTLPNSPSQNNITSAP